MFKYKNLNDQQYQVVLIDSGQVVIHAMRIRLPT